MLDPLVLGLPQPDVGIVADEVDFVTCPSSALADTVNVVVIVAI